MNQLLYGIGAAIETNADYQKQIKGLVFDCDGTVLDTMEFYYPSWEKVCNDNQIQFSKRQFYQLAGVPVKEIFEQLITSQNLKLDIEMLLRQKHEFVNEYAKTHQAGRIDCVCEIVIANYGKCPMAIASSGIKQNVIESLKKNDMLKYFDVIVTHEDVKSGLNKPAPDIFLLACEKLGITPEYCRGFEDADVGMQSLNAAKIDAVDVRKMKNYPHKFN